MKKLIGASFFIMPPLMLAKNEFFEVKCELQQQYQNKNIIVTGCSQGIGYELVRLISENKQNFNLIMANRDQEQSLKIIEELKLKNQNIKYDFIKLDLNDVNSIKQFHLNFIQKYDKLDILVNNAGTRVYFPEYTVQKLEKTFGVNYFGPFVLTMLLLPELKKSQEPRIINVSSIAHKRAVNFDPFTLSRKYNSLQSYEFSKLCNILFTKYLAQEYPQITSVSLHPGIVRTSLMHQFWNQNPISTILSTITYPFIYLFTKNANQGAQTYLYCMNQDVKKLQNGAYYADCQLTKSSAISMEQKNIDDLMKFSFQIKL